MKIWKKVRGSVGMLSGRRRGVASPLTLSKVEREGIIVEISLV